MNDWVFRLFRLLFVVTLGASALLVVVKGIEDADRLKMPANAQPRDRQK
jgi:hypothetical protein